MMGSGNFTLLALLAVVIGALIPVQAATNAAMSRAVGSVQVASLVLFAVGLVSVAIWTLATRSPLPTLSTLRQAPSYGFLGGVIVASYVLAITFLAPRLGVGNAICFVVTGQIAAAVLIDHFGAFGAAPHAFTLHRGVGVVLMVVGLFLAKRG